PAGVCGIVRNETSARIESRAAALRPRTWHMRAPNGGTIERLEPRRMLALSLLADFNTTTAGSYGYGPVPLGASGYFFGDDGVHGYELWKTDGTAAGTSLLKDINPGPGNSIITTLQPAAGLIYFSADDG